MNTFVAVLVVLGSLVLVATSAVLLLGFCMEARSEEGLIRRQRREEMEWEKKMLEQQDAMENER